MDDAEEQDKKTWALRKRKAIYLFEEDYDSSSSDYKPPKDFENDKSDDSIYEAKKRVKKYKKKKNNHNNSESETTEKTSHEFLSGPENDSSDDCISEGKKLGKKSVKEKASHNDDKQEVRRKKSRRRGRPPLEKSTAHERKKRKKEINNSEKEKGSESQQIQESRSSRTPRLGPYSVIGHWYIASGFMQDLTDLFKAFDEQNSWRFKAFATCWQKFKFSLVYRGRYSFKELLEFTEEICFWAKKFLSPLHTTKWRVGALYVLYGLYYKHPFRHFYKVRMEIEEYENLASLAESFQSSAENPDPAYIFYKLKSEGVFLYVATSDEMGLNFYSMERYQDIMNYEMQWVLHEHSANVVFPERERNVQKTLMEEYQKVKSQIWGKGPDKALSYVKPNILSEVDTILAGLQEDSPQHPATHSQASADVNHSNAAPAEISDIGRRKSEIRKKAAALSTTDCFFKRKQLRSPQKSYKKKNDQHNRKSSADSVSDNANTEEDFLSMYDDSEKVMRLKKIMEFMQPPDEGTLDISLKSFRNKKHRTLQKDLTEEKNDSNSNGACDIIDSQNILLPNESLQQKPEELKASKKDENTTSLPLRTCKNGRPRKSNSPRKVVQCKKTLPINKTRTTALPEQKRRERPRKSNPKNTVKCEPHEDSQITERNEILARKGGPENLLKKNVSISNASVSNKQKKVMQKGVVKKLNEKTLPSDTSPQEKEENKPKTTHKQIYLPRSSRGRLEKLNKPRKAPSCITEEAISSAGSNKENSSVLDKNLSEKACKEVCDDQEIISENVCEEVCKHQAIVSENVCEEVFDDQATSNTNVCEESFNNQIVNTTNVFPDVCNDTIRTGFKSHQNNASASHIINDMQNTLASLSQENCSDMNHVGKVLEVEILVSIPKKKNLKSILKAESMVYLEVHFKENNRMVHSIKFKMSKKDLKTLQSNKEKLEGLKKKLHSSLPSKYANYELHLQLNILQSVIEGNGTFDEEQCKQDSEPLPEQHSKQGYDKQDSDPSQEGHFRHVSEPSSDEHSKQDFEPTPVLAQASGTLTKAENTLSKAGSTLSNKKPFTSYSQKGKGPLHMTEDKFNALSFSHGTCSDTNFVGNVIQVKMVASVPKQSNIQTVLKAESLVHLNVNFLVEDVTIHSVKFQITKKDLDTLQNNKKKLESLKAKFCSFLPSKYQKYELLMQLTVPQSVTDGNKTIIKHSRQGSDSSKVLPQGPATPFKVNNATPQMESLTSHSQKGLSKNLTANEVHMPPSKSAAPIVQHKSPSKLEVKGCYSSKPADQSKDYTSTAAQSTHTRSDSLPLQKTTESPVCSLINEESHHSEPCNIPSNSEDSTYVPLPNTQNELPEQLQVNHQTIIYIIEDSFPNENTANGIDAIMEENKAVETENQISPYKEEIVPTTHVESKPVNMSECKTDVIYMDRTITGTQVCGAKLKECASPKSLDAEKSLLTIQANSSLEEPGYDFMKDVLSTSSPAWKSKDIRVSPDKCIKPTYVKEEISHSTESSKKCTHELDTENCTILWKAKSNPTTMNDKSLLTSLPFRNSSCGDFKIIEEQGKASSKTVRMTRDMSLNADSSKSLESVSTVNESLRSSKNIVMKEANVLSPLSHYPSKSLSKNLPESARTDSSVSKTNDNSVCSFYFFSKRNKCNIYRRKQTRPSSDSRNKKPCVPFLFMKNLLSKKE